MDIDVVSSQPSLESGTYELILQRLTQQGSALRSKLDQLNLERKSIFGSTEIELSANDRITTEHHCIPRDMVPIGQQFIFGYNVHMGLRTSYKLSDVFSMYSFDPEHHHFQESSMDLLADAKFEEDFRNLYTYYKDTVFSRFLIQGPHLYMIFQNGKSIRDTKSFKWAIQKGKLVYLGNRFDHEIKEVEQHSFQWVRTNRDMHRKGKHPHISMLDRVFVETIGGDLTIKIEDNTDTGHGIYAESVEEPNQTLDDATCYFADLGNLIILKIKPYRENSFRYIIYNEKMQEAIRVDALEHACVLLPDDHGIIFSNGYYLQNGEYKIFDSILPGLRFEKSIPSANGEDMLYVFYQPMSGLYVLLSYNLVEQQVFNPLVCHGYSLFANGELCLFKAEDEPARHHLIQIWKTPFSDESVVMPASRDSYLANIGSKDLVRGMAECRELLSILHKGERYDNLYVELVRKSQEIQDSYYWIGNEEAFNLKEPLERIGQTAATAIEEYEKVKRIRKETAKAFQETEAELEGIMDKIRRYPAKATETFVAYLADLRKLRGKVIGLKDLRYTDLAKVEVFEEQVIGQTDQLSADCATFLANEEALHTYIQVLDRQESALEEVEKVAEAEAVSGELDQLASALELLIETVSNLPIEDTTKSTHIVEHISSMYARLNQIRARLRQVRQSLLKQESQASFKAQLALLEQSITNYIELSDTPEKCDTNLSKLMITLEELEGKYIDFEEYVQLIQEKRETIYEAFESKKLQLSEQRNRQIDALAQTAQRILTNISHRANSLEALEAIHSYFASDVMVNKVRNVVDQLMELSASVQADDIVGQLKSTQEEAIRQLKDRSDLFVEGENIIRLGKHHFTVNVRSLELTILPRNGSLSLHLTGTHFFEEIEDEEIQQYKEIWDQELPSENKEVYRGEVLAYEAWQRISSSGNQKLQEGKELEVIHEIMRNAYDGGYVKGVHDQDALLILKAIKEMTASIDLLHFSPQVRSAGILAWHIFLSEEEKTFWDHRMKGAGAVMEVFPQQQSFLSLIKDLEKRFTEALTEEAMFPVHLVGSVAAYVFEERSRGDAWVISAEAASLYTSFLQQLDKSRRRKRFDQSLAHLNAAPKAKYELIVAWLSAFMLEKGEARSELYVPEAAALLFAGVFDQKQVIDASTHRTLEGMLGVHSVIQDGSYELDYLGFQQKMQSYISETMPMYRQFIGRKKELLEMHKRRLKLESFHTSVLTSFVRNQLIDKVYLPLFGDNLAKQMGTAGENTRTDRMGLLLLISPPGYGKTTLMEYIADRLGLIFMKINGPSLGHQVTSLDPGAAPNAAAREELEKLNLALEMGDNIMIYLDDIQHCHPEFLQKFISLCDAQRRIEGVYKGKTQTYDLRGKKVAVVMAGNPYTESGERFQIPDMLANRADTYNLGDVIGEHKDSFELSYLENAMSSNDVLHRLSTKSQSDIQQVIRMAAGGDREHMSFEGHISPEELQEYVAVLEKCVMIRDVILKVNQAYIHSAAQEDAFRKEPPFQLQGSYRNMNKMTEKVLPIMSEEEVKGLILSHYEREAQTLTTGAEANLLKFKQLVGWMNSAEEARWKEIVAIYQREKLLQGDRLGQLVQHMEAFSKGLIDIREVLEKGMNGKE